MNEHEGHQEATEPAPPEAAEKTAEQGAGYLLGKFLTRIIAIAVVLGAGLGIWYGLKLMQKPPKRVDMGEPTLQVEVKQVFPEDVPVTITGYGQARALDIVQVTAEVPGEIVEVHNRLDQGELIPEGELLFRIDQRDYIANRDAAKAQTGRAASSVALLKRQYAINQERLETVRRTRDLARQEYERVRELYTKDEVGTQSGVDKAEMAFNQAEDALDQLSQLVELAPMQIQEAQSALEAAKAQLALAEVRLERTEVHAPFDARIKQPVQLEAGQYVAPGVPVLVLANDAMLEISVPLDSRDARSWLVFREKAAAGTESWFSQVEPVSCRVSWTEDTGDLSWEGTLHRVEQFDQMTRTVTVAVRINGEDARTAHAGLPLVDGMFCEVSIPGRTMADVYRLPRWAVSFEGQAYVADGERLTRRDVTAVRSEGEETFISEGLEPGELVITTRLVNPLPNSLLEYGKEEIDMAAAQAVWGDPDALGEKDSGAAREKTAAETGDKAS
jgi:hypothetical protein